MNWLEAIFWLCVACVLGTYLAYPLVLALASRLWRRPVQRGTVQGPVSIVLAVHNEAANIERRLEELTGLLESSGLHGEIIVVSDGSTDATAPLARAFAPRGVRLIELAGHEGKAAALTRGVAVAQHPIVVFADARQSWAADALPQLLSNFADPRVGAVSGDLVLRDGAGVLTGRRALLALREMAAPPGKPARLASRRHRGRSAPCGGASSVRSRPARSSTTSTGRCTWSCRATGWSTTSGPRRSISCRTGPAMSFAARSGRSVGISSSWP